MNTNQLPTPQEDVFRQKAARRRDLAALPIEQKLIKLVKLQQIAYTIGRQVGREQRRPWRIKAPAQS